MAVGFRGLCPSRWRRVVGGDEVRRRKAQLGVSDKVGGEKGGWG